MKKKNLNLQFLENAGTKKSSYLQRNFLKFEEPNKIPNLKNYKTAPKSEVKNEE